MTTKERAELNDEVKNLITDSLPPEKVSKSEYIDFLEDLIDDLQSMVDSTKEEMEDDED